MSRYIDAEEVEKRIDVVIGSEPKAWDKKALKELKMYIVHAVPSADVRENVRGEWIDCTEDGYVECPFCHSATNCDGNKEELHFCFSCGAKMEVEK